MIIIRDEKRITRLKKRSQRLSLVGLLFLLVGMAVLFVGESFGLTPQSTIWVQMTALLLGLGLSQYGVYLAHRYGRSPRPDEVLDQAIRRVVRDGRMYHYLLPAPHVLLTPAGPVIFNLKFQTGNIYVEGEKWKQKGVGFRRFFSQEGLGNPTREIESMIGALAGYIRKHAPDLEEVPIGALIVFTTKDIQNLDVQSSRIPAMHYTKLRGYLKQKGLGKSLPKQQYEMLQTAFDSSATGLL